KHDSIFLTIAGDGDLRYVNKLKRLTVSLGLSERVHWAGFVLGARKDAVFREAAAFILPSLSENFGVAVVEALAAGLPCIVSRGVAISGEVEEAGAGAI